jgi:D-3-phosphoglycerate dehydrogenase
MPNILVADKIAEQGLEKLRQAAGVTFEVRHGLSPQQLGEIAGQYDGMLIRSGVKVTRETLANPGRLVAIARAGVGVDNVDLEAATEAGVLVLNTPDANTISTAEHTFAVMLALHRNVVSAHHHLTGGGWNRGAYQGDQLAGKTLGVVGYGRIGRAVAHRALAFEMNVVVFDPFVSAASGSEEPVRLVGDLSELLAAADCVTLHASLSDTTRHMIGAKQLAAMKPGAKLINCARGALIDEAALAEALNRGRLSGAGIDVYENEPPKDSPLLTAKNVVLTPHLAASTVEAQTQVSTDAVDALLAYLLKGEIRSAVNVTGLPSTVTPRGRAFVDLCSRMGTILSPWCTQGVERINVTAYGEALEELAGTLAWQAMVAVLSPHLAGRLNLVNAREQAKRRGIKVEYSAESAESNAAASVSVTVHSQGQQHGIEGTVLTDGGPRVLAIDGYRMEIIPERHLVLIFNDDRPGVIGLVGQRVGDAGINIADMALSRRGKTALMVLKLDEPLPDPVRDALRAANPPILSIRTISLPTVPST